MGSSDSDKINQASGGCASVSGINRSFASAFLLTKDKELMEKLFISNAVSFTRNSVVSNFIKPLFCCEPFSVQLIAASNNTGTKNLNDLILNLNK